MHILCPQFAFYYRKACDSFKNLMVLSKSVPVSQAILYWTCLEALQNSIMKFHYQLGPYEMGGI